MVELPPVAVTAMAVDVAVWAVQFALLPSPPPLLLRTLSAGIDELDAITAAMLSIQTYMSHLSYIFLRLLSIYPFFHFDTLREGLF